MIIVHHLNNSRSQRILWLLEELGLPYEIKTYMRGPDQLAPKELWEVNPLGKSPAITDTSRGNKVIIESGAIIAYIIKYYGNGRGVASPENDDDNVFWTQFAEGSVMSQIVMKYVFMLIPTHTPFFVRPLVSYIMHKAQGVATDPNLMAIAKFTGDALVEKGGAGAWFAGGDKDGGPTAADYQMLFPLEVFSSPRAASITVPNVIKEWVDRVHTRPAYIRALQKGGPYDYARL
ncbi:glutathione transferase [Malassezia sp. CBS 17886]|nr:glutathione transferase [Malassezia sp. CBS 17886]